MNTRTLAIVLVLGGVAYLLMRKDPVTGRSLADNFLGSIAPGIVAPGTAGLQTMQASGAGGTQPNRSAAIAGTIAGAAASILPIVTGGGSAVAAGSGSAAAGGAGLGLAGALTFTGIAAGAAVLAWGIITKGWFRGGEEGVIVNPARDSYFDYFIAHSSFAGLPTFSDRQFAGSYQTVLLKEQYPAWGTSGAYVQTVNGAYLIHDIRLEAYAEVARRAGMPESEIARTRDALVRADTKDRWQAATQDANATFQRFETAQAA